MRYSLIQQLVKQDLFLYRMVITLRSDHAWRLISTPTIMNEVRQNRDGIILNLLQLAVQFPIDEDWTKSKISVLSQEEPGHLQEDQLAILPCFTAVDNDLESLEIPGNCASAVVRSHIQLSALRQTILTRFSAAVELTDLGALSNVLVGQRTWASQPAQTEKDAMLGDISQAEQLYKNWQRNAVAQVIQTFQDQKTAEKKLYREYSFFAWQNTHDKGNPPGTPDLPPTWDPLVYKEHCE